MKATINILLVLTIAGMAASCKKYLDVSKELGEQTDIEKIFSNPNDTRRWHRNIYLRIPNTADYARDLNGFNLPWPFLADELDRQPIYDINLIPYTSGSTTYGRWPDLYDLIRQANVFLEKAVEIPQSGTADYLNAEELNELKAQALFLRAYYHYLLFELYGPIPIMTVVADPGSDELDYERNTVDEVVAFIDSEMLAVAQLLKDPDLNDAQKLAVPTKGTALAVRARLWMYAASPLFNGGYQEALQLKNPDGKSLFPPGDATKWQKALSAMQDFIDYANSGHYELYKAYTNGAYDPDKSLYELFMSYNKEVIFARSDVSWGSAPTNGVDGWSVPRGTAGGNTLTGYIAVTQALVDDFFMRDGLPIDESALYKETGFSTAGEDPTKRTETGTRRMYVNREPRFYQTVFYNRRRWHVGNQQIIFSRPGNSDNGSETSNTTGYILYKRLSKRVYNGGSNPRSEYRPGIIFRLAEFYLLYAEALNEVSPNDPRIIEYIDKVRERAGIPKLADIKAGIRGNQQAQREAIRREMRVELAAEGQRYFDVRRWMIAENPPGKGGQGGAFYGMNMLNTTTEDFYTRTLIENRVFERRMYLYPIPLSEIQISKKLVQNPLY
ncbi:MAG: RagB/SusD family nutrient uptake outer membrane protein [Agriterribacter sp.]